LSIINFKSENNDTRQSYVLREDEGRISYTKV